MNNTGEGCVLGTDKCAVGLEILIYCAYHFYAVSEAPSEQP